MTLASLKTRLRAGGAGRTAALIALLVAGQLGSAGTAGADVITTWNGGVNVIGGPQIQRTWAMVHLAMFDAVNAIEGGYTPYQTALPTPAIGASSEAAAAAAAHGVLVRLFPARAADLATALALSLSTIPNDAAKTSGVAFGDAVEALKAMGWEAAPAFDGQFSPQVQGGFVDRAVQDKLDLFREEQL